MHVRGSHQFLFVAGLLTVHYLLEALIRDEDVKALSLQGQYQCTAHSWIPHYCSAEHQNCLIC